MRAAERGGIHVAARRLAIERRDVPDAALDDRVGHRAHLVDGKFEIGPHAHRRPVLGATAVTCDSGSGRGGGTRHVFYRYLMNQAWLPKSVLLLRHYSRDAFVADLLAGLTVGLVALPLAMAFAISSGVPPQSGIYCAIVAGFLISALGGSRHQIGGPTGAFVVVVADIVATYGLDGLFMCTMMAGVMLILLGATGMGTAVNFIPRPVVVGFTNGIGVLIASTQIKDFLGLRVEVPSEFWPRMVTLARNARDYSFRGRGARRGDGRDADRLAPATCRACRATSSPCWAARRRSSCSAFRSRPSARGSAASRADGRTWSCRRSAPT